MFKIETDDLDKGVVDLYREDGSSSIYICSLAVEDLYDLENTIHRFIDDEGY